MHHTVPKCARDSTLHAIVICDEYHGFTTLPRHIIDTEYSNEPPDQATTLVAFLATIFWLYKKYFYVNWFNTSEPPNVVASTLVFDLTVEDAYN